jgi:hypothetical protein
MQARAIRRAGELLKQIMPSKGGRPELTQGGAPPSLTRKQARAIRRAGELLKQIMPSKGGRPQLTSAGADTSLTRKQARAIRRAGELLKQIMPKKGARTDLEHMGGAPPMLNRKQAGDDAGFLTSCRWRHYVNPALYSGR